MRDIYLLGIDGGTESIRVGLFDPTGRPVAIASEPYPLFHPRPGWAEQQPEDWWAALASATRRALATGNVPADAIAGISLDCTSCTVVAADREGHPLRPAILWMDVRAAEQARRIAATQDPALKYCGFATVSAEWLPCKALWLKEHEPETYSRAERICEYTDWLVHRLTGEWTASINTASIRAFYDRKQGGWPRMLYDAVGLDDLLEKLPPRVLDMGVVVGSLRREAAAELGLRPGIPVAEGGADAFVAMIGLGVLEPGRMALITGSSHLLLGQVDRPFYGPGFFGAYTDAVLPGQYTIEAGQTSTGSVVKWYREQFAASLAEQAACTGTSTYEALDAQAAAIPPGAEGLIVLEYWQGNRTPYVDPHARGAIWGMSLKHTAAHIYRAIIEGICYGTEHILRVFHNYGYQPQELVVCGGPTRSRLWLQIHADVSGLPLSIPRVTDAALLGSAMLAAVGAGVHPNIGIAAREMVAISERIEPDLARYDLYRFFVDKYITTYERLKDLMHEMTAHIAALPTA